MTVHVTERPVPCPGESHRITSCGHRLMTVFLVKKVSTSPHPSLSVKQEKGNEKDGEGIRKGVHFRTPVETPKQMEAEGIDTARCHDPT